MAEVVTGTLLEKAVNKLFDVVNQNLEHKPLLKKVTEKLEVLKKLIEDIPGESSVGGVESIMMKNLQNGTKLIENCRKYKSSWKNVYGLFKKSGFNGELRSLAETLDDLLRILTLKVQSYQARLIERLCEKNILTKVTGLRCPLPKPPTKIVGLSKPLGKLRELILKPGKSMILVTGPAGCGKTTLAQMLCHDPKVTGVLKNNIFFVDISVKLDLKYIVEQLFIHRGYQYTLPPTLNNENATLSYLQDFLRAGNEPVLLVLDGVWRDVGYDDLLEKLERLEVSKLKILVTSRFHFENRGSSYCLKWIVDADAREHFHYSVSLEDADAEVSDVTAKTSQLVRSQWVRKHFGSSYSLKWLEDEDAKELFYHSASLEENCKILKDCPEEVPQILKYCKGLPLAITKVGDQLRRQRPDVWKGVRKSHKSVLQYAGSVHKKVESSLKGFEAEDPKNKILKNCFLDLASFPEDRLISAAALIDIWSLSQTYDYYTKAEIDIMCIDNLNMLKDRTLVNIVHPRDYMNGYVSEHFVIQYEMLRELIIYQAESVPIEQRERIFMNICGDNFPKWIKQQKMSKPMKAHLLAISTDRAFSTEWQLPDLEVLVLNLQTESYEFLPDLMAHVNKVKLLIVTYYGPSTAPAALSNLHLLGSLSNLKRVRFERTTIPCLVKNRIQLKNIEKISFFMCDIVQAFGDTSFNFSEAFPKLEELNIDYCSVMETVPANLCDHKVLQRLSITNCLELQSLPEEIGNLDELKELRLLGCTSLSKLPQTVAKIKCLELLDVSGCTSMKIPAGIREEFKSRSEMRFIE